MRIDRVVLDTNVLISAIHLPYGKPFACLNWVLDNATLVALEVHSMSLPRAREAIIALLVSGGMLIPGNIPNVISAGALRIGSGAWARVGIPIGLVGLGIYFALLKLMA